MSLAPIIYQKEVSYFEEILKDAKNTKICVCLDWLSILFYYDYESNLIIEPIKDNGIFIASENITIKDIDDGGTKVYKYRYEILYKNENVATLCCFPHNSKFTATVGTVKVDFKNHILYTNNVVAIYEEIVTAFNLTYKNTSRLDIAVDGLNYIVEFINEWQRQRQQSKVVELVGQGMLRLGVYDKKICKIESFKMGKGAKVLSIYNKSLELTKSRKDYIQEIWLKNGVIKELLPLEILEKTTKKEKMYLDGYENIYRVELRLEGKRVKAIKNFKIEYLQDVNYQMSILKLHLQKFLEFVLLDDKRIERCTRIDIIPYERFEIKQLEKIKPKEKDLLYSTKLSISKDVRQLYYGTHSVDNASLLEMLIFNIERFDLLDWFKKRVYFWKKEYSLRGKQTVTQIKEADNFIFSLVDEIEQKKQQEQLLMF